jgi:hypothetical protein
MNTGKYKEFLGDNHHITIDGIDYHLSPHCYGGGCDLIGRAPRTEPRQEGGRTWVHSELTLTERGEVECKGAVIGKIEAGQYLAYASPRV